MCIIVFTYFLPLNLYKIVLTFLLGPYLCYYWATDNVFDILSAVPFTHFPYKLGVL